MKKVSISGNKLLIDGNERILLCSSLFYFRIPMDLWEERMKKIKQMGYNTLDVYFPWNYHERDEGKWNFIENRDVEKFLQLADKHQLYVIARPGPYICSEWDMGGLPAYLLTKNIPLRQNHPEYLAHVEKWFAKILPILEKYQYMKNGSIIALQIENELDFYNCEDVNGYITTLKEMADEYNFKIPLIACAGQGDVAAATGHVKGVIPALNLYPSAYNRDFASLVSHALSHTEKMDVPLLVTETNRDITMIRMLFGVGASLIAPYNQVGGTNNEYYNGVNNWGKPNAFMASDYDFDSLVKANGEYGSGEKEALLFKGIYKLFETTLAKGTVIQKEPIQGKEVHYVNQRDEFCFHTFLNPEENELTIEVENTFLKLLPQQVHYVVENLSLLPYQVEGKIKLATTEIIGIERKGKELVIQTATRTNGELILQFNKDMPIMIDNERMEEDELRFAFTDQPKRYSLNYGDCQIIIENIAIANIAESKRKALFHVDTLKVSEVKNVEKSIVPTNQNSEEMYLEDAGIYYGVGEYEFELTGEDANSSYLLLENPGDILSIFQEELYLGTIANGGFTTLLPIHGEINKKFRINAEIWGHSNFDDNITPNTLLDSKRGIRSVIAVNDCQDISGQWYLVNLAGEIKEDLFQSFGSYLHVSDEFIATYRKTVYLGKGNNVQLYFEKSEATYEINVNGQYLGTVSKGGFFDISSFAGEQSIQLDIVVRKEHHSIPAGKIKMIQGNKIKKYSLAKVEIEKGVSSEFLESATLPVNLLAGYEYLVKVPLENYQNEQAINLRIHGENIVVTAFAHNCTYSRLFLSNNHKQSKVSGGNPHLMYLPCSVIKDNEITLYVKAINEESSLKTVEHPFV